MNSRRDFFKQLAIGAASFSILPSAETYSRIWRPKLIVEAAANPDWITAEYDITYWANNPIFKRIAGIEFHTPEGPLRYVVRNGFFEKA